jgi:hypothetical protein
MLFETDLNTYAVTLTTVFAQQKKYEYVYVSIGSKYNQHDVYFYSYNSPLAKRVDTNALEQMVPVFLRIKPIDRNILVIVIDTFNTDNDIQMNRRLIQSILTENMDCILINMFCTNDNLHEFCSKLIAKVLLENIHESNCMICNYVKFLNMPNELEKVAEAVIPATVQSVLSRPDFNKYKDCYYEWYGYRNSLYNCIYNVSYAKSNLYFHKRAHDLEIKMEQLANLHRRPIQVIYDKNIVGLLTHSYDITSPYDVDSDTGFSLSLYQMHSPLS